MAREVHVHPTLGSDTDGDGSVEAPVRSVSRALALAPAEVAEWTVRLAPGIYSEASGETFPLSLALTEGRRTVRLVGPDPASGEIAVFISGSEIPSYVDILGSDVTEEEAAIKTDGEPTLFEVGHVRFDGAEAALSIVGGELQTIEVRVHDCAFLNQKTHSLEIFSGDHGRVTVTVENTTFSGHPVTALDLATGQSSHLDIHVEGNEFRGVPLVGAFPLRTGVSVFLDADSRVTGEIENNFILDMGDGLLLATSEPWTFPGTMELVVQGNFLAGSVDPWTNGQERAIYVSLHPHHQYDLKFYHNTLAMGVHGVYFEGLTPDWIEDQCNRIGFEFMGNAVYGFESGDFSIEGDPAFGPGLPLPPPVTDVEFLLNCFLIEGNGLDRSALVDAGFANFQILDGDLEFTAYGYRPSGPTSSLVDSSLLVDMFTLDSVDLTGECRMTDGNSDGEFVPDVGAFEAPGLSLCGAEVFLRGDCDGNGAVQITDAINLLGYLFLGTFEPSCPDACDTNDDGNIDLSDPLYILTFLFIGGIDPIPAPYPEPGPDTTGDALEPCLPGVVSTE